MASGRMVDYLGKGLAAARPVSLSLTTGALGIYFATDTGAVSYWDGSAWAAIKPAVQSVTSSATVTPTFSDDLVKITAQAVGLTLANPSGTAVDGKRIGIRIKDNGTARAIAYGAQYRAIGVTLPATTVISKTLYLYCIWNSDDAKLDVVDVKQEA